MMNDIRDIIIAVELSTCDSRAFCRTAVLLNIVFLIAMTPCRWSRRGETLTTDEERPCENDV